MKTIGCMKTLVGSTVLALAVTLTLGACSSSEKKQENAPPAPPTAHEQAVNQLQSDRDAYISRTDAKITQYQQHAENLRARAATQQKPLDKKLSNAAEDMEANLKDIRSALGEVKAAAPQNWLDYKRDVEKAINRADAQYANSTTLLQ